MMTFCNRTTGRVDLVDKLWASYACARNARLWPTVIFYCILNVAGINSCNTHNENNGSKIIRHDFVKKLCFEIIQEQLEEGAACSTLPIDLRAEYLALI